MILPILSLLSMTADISAPIKYTQIQIHNPIAKGMGVTVTLFRISQAEKLSEIKDIDAEVQEKENTKVFLEQYNELLDIIFANKVDPYEDPSSFTLKLVYGNISKEEKYISAGIIGGFIPYSQVNEMVTWFKDHKLEKIDGFNDLWKKLSPEVKNQLAEYGADDDHHTFLYKDYIQPLVKMYITALEQKNAIVIVSGG